MKGKNINGSSNKKIKLKKLINRYYFRIELVDENGGTHILDKPLLCDYINFRRQVFGIMSACGSYDLMELATTNPIEKMEERLLIY